MPQDLEKFRPVEPAVVVHPAPHRRVECSSQIFQALVVPGRSHPPVTDGLPDRFGGLGADRWQEAHEVLPPAILRPSRLEGVAEEVKRDMLAISSSIVVLAVNDPGLHRVKLQTALLEPITDRFEHLLRVPLAPAMDDGVVCIALELDRRKGPSHPDIERVVQEQVGEQRADDPTLRGALRPLLLGTVRGSQRGTKPPCNVQPDPRKIGVLGDGTLDEIMTETVEERLDIQINDPVGAPAPFPRDLDGVECRLAGAIAVRVFVEDRLHERLQDHLHGSLRDSVRHRRDPEGSGASAILRYLNEPHRWREVRARRHPVPDLVQVAPQILLEHRQRLAINARGALVLLHPLIRIPHELLRNHIRLCFRHRLLPSLVGQFHLPESWAPSLCPRYQASSLQRAHPSLRLASILSSSRVLRLEFSLRIEAEGLPRSAREPALCSRRLHAGHHASSRQAPLALVPSQRLELGFGGRPYAFDTSSTVHFRSSSQRTPDGLVPTCPSRSPPRSFWTRAASGGLSPGPATRARGACPHF